MNYATTLTGSHMPKIKRKGENLPTYLNHGDSIEVSMSNELKIDGDSAWVSYKVFAKIAEDETSAQTHERVMNHLRVGVSDAVNKTVELNRELGE